MMRAGYIQYNPVLGDQKENIRKLSELLNSAAGADLMVIPELANSGYHFESKEQAFSLSESLDNSIYLGFLEEKARQLKMFIVSGINERDDERLFNTAILVGPGGYLGKYRKIHLFMNEFDFFEKGNLGLPVFDIGKCKIGILICFDWVFPEVWRILAMNGADVICHPSNLVLPCAQQAVPVHGLINKTYVVTANRFGTEREITFSGQSFISDPEGKTLAKAPADKNEVQFLTLDIQKSRNKMITPRNHVLNDRLPEYYQDLVSRS